MKKSHLGYSSLPFPERLRKLRDEQGWTRETLANRIRALGHSISLATIIKMEERKANKRYRLPKRHASDISPIQAVAEAFGIPLGYLLGGFSQNEIEASCFGRRVKNGEIEVIHSLIPSDNESFADFLKSLPTKKEDLLALNLTSYRNERAFAVIFRVEKIYDGLELLVVNEPPLIFWDTEDVDLWVRNMGLNHRDSVDFRMEFQKYRDYFRARVKDGKKVYRVVLNHTTFIKFLRRKSAEHRAKQIDDIIHFLQFPNFNLVILRPEMHHLQRDELDEVEVISKEQSYSVDSALSVQIKQTPPDHSPVEYFVTPVPPNRFFLQSDKNRVDEAWAKSLDQYERDYKNKMGEGGIDMELQKKLSCQMLEEIKKLLRGA